MIIVARKEDTRRFFSLSSIYVIQIDKEKDFKQINTIT